jgi:HSP20 family protein
VSRRHGRSPLGRVTAARDAEAGAARGIAGHAVRIRLELPGIPKESVQVWVRGDCIEVAGEKAPDFPPGEASFLCLERIFGKFRRVFEVVGSVNLGQVSARMRDGILVVTIPKIAERRGRERRVPVTGE